MGLLVYSRNEIVHPGHLTWKKLVTSGRRLTLEFDVLSGFVNKRSLLRLLTILVTGALLLQSAAAAVGFVDQSNMSSAELCSTSLSSSGAASGPVTPDTPITHHNSCCILHAVAFVLPIKISHASLIRLQFPDERLKPWASVTAIAQRLEPSRAPQSPRAPPRHS